MVFATLSYFTLLNDAILNITHVAATKEYGTAFCIYVLFLEMRDQIVYTT